MNALMQSPDQAEADLFAMFLALPPIGKADVLAAFTHWETIRAREAYWQPDAPIDGQALRQSNEQVHRLAGYAIAVLRGEATSECAAQIARMIAQTSVERSPEELDRLRARLRKASDIYTTVPFKPGSRP